MYTAGKDTKTTTLIAFIGPRNESDIRYTAISILFADDFDHTALPKSVRARKLMTIDCTPKKGNERNETGLKRFAKIKEALQGTKFEVIMPYGNSVTEEEFEALTK